MKLWLPLLLFVGFAAAMPNRDSFHLNPHFLVRREAAPEPHHHGWGGGGWGGGGWGGGGWGGGGYGGWGGYGGGWGNGGWGGGGWGWGR